MNEQNGGHNAGLLSPGELQSLLAKLTDILEQENRQLDARKPRALQETAQEKNRLVAIYNQQMRLIAASPDAFRKASDARAVEALKTASRSFHDSLDDHFRKLSTVKSVTEGIVKSISAEVEKKSRPAPGYGANAHLRPAGVAARQTSAATSIALNRVI